MKHHTIDTSIPTLTEIIAAPANEPAPAQEPTPAPAPRPTLEQLLEPTIGWRAEERVILELQLNERILRRLQGSIDFVLEHRVRDSLADVLQTAIEGLTSEIRRGLQQTLEEVIARAVAQEIARLQTPKK